jgi:hypothetical protein
MKSYCGTMVLNIKCENDLNYECKVELKYKENLNLKTAVVINLLTYAFDYMQRLKESKQCLLELL